MMRHRYWSPADLGLAGWNTVAVVPILGATITIPRHCVALCFMVVHTSAAFTYRMRFYVKDLANANIAVGAFPGDSWNIGPNQNNPAQTTVWAMGEGTATQWGQPTGASLPRLCGSILNAERIQPVIDITAGGVGAGNCYAWALFND